MTATLSLLPATEFMVAPRVGSPGQQPKGTVGPGEPPRWALPAASTLSAERRQSSGECRGAERPAGRLSLIVFPPGPFQPMLSQKQPHPERERSLRQQPSSASEASEAAAGRCTRAVTSATTATCFPQSGLEVSYKKSSQNLGGRALGGASAPSQPISSRPAAPGGPAAPRLPSARGSARSRGRAGCGEGPAVLRCS